jgi:DNA polymerase-3 subunit beta
MKLTIPRKPLLEALASIKSAAGRSMPILSCVAISTFEKSAELVCCNLDLTLRAKLECDIAKRGETCVPATLLHDLVKSFTGETVDLETDKSGLNLVCGTSRYTLAVLPIGEFPPAPSFRNAQEFELPQGVLRALLASTAYCASTDDARFIIQSSLLRLNGNVTVVSTDGRRLGLDSANVEGLPKPTGKGGQSGTDYVLPSGAVRELIRLLPLPSRGSATEEKLPSVKVVTAENLCRFHIGMPDRGSVTLTTKLVEGKYPNFAQVIPSIRGRKPIAIGRADLLGCLQRTALISDDVKLAFHKQSLTITAINEKGLGKAEESLLIAPAEKLTMVFNVHYLIEALASVTDDEVQFYGADVGEPGVLHVAGKAWTSVIMPKGKADNKPKAVEKPADTKAAGAASAAMAAAPVESKPAAAKATGATSKAEAPKPEPVAATK